MGRVTNSAVAARARSQGRVAASRVAALERAERIRLLTGQAVQAQQAQRELGAASPRATVPARVARAARRAEQDLALAVRGLRAEGLTLAAIAEVVGLSVPEAKRLASAGAVSGGLVPADVPTGSGRVGR